MEFKLCASLRATTDYDEYESRRKHLRGKITSILSNHEEEIGKVVKLDRKYLDWDPKSNRMIKSYEKISMSDNEKLVSPKNTTTGRKIVNSVEFDAKRNVSL